MRGKKNMQAWNNSKHHCTPGATITLGFSSTLMKKQHIGANIPLERNIHTNYRYLREESRENDHL